MLEYKKELKDQTLKLKVSKSEKEVVTEFCERHGISLSNFMREAMVREMRRRDGKEV